MEHMSVPARQALREVMVDRGSRVVSCLVTYRGATAVNRNYARVTVQGEGLTAYTDPRPGDAFKLHLPACPGDAVPVPGYTERGRLVWPDHLKARPSARCFTVQSFDAERCELSFDALLHSGGATSQWLRTASVGDSLSLTGMRVEFVDVETATAHLLIGDDSSFPAIASIIATLPSHAAVTVLLLSSFAESDFPAHAGLTVRRFGNVSQLLESLRALGPLAAGTQVWVGAEAEVVREVRRFLLGAGGIERDALHASAYWKQGLDWEQGFDESLDRYLAGVAAGLDVGDPGVLQSLAFD